MDSATSSSAQGATGVDSAARINLLDLPNEALENIFYYVSVICRLAFSKSMFDPPLITRTRALGKFKRPRELIARV